MQKTEGQGTLQQDSNMTEIVPAGQIEEIQEPKEVALSEFKPIMTQEDLDIIVEERIRGNAEMRRQRGTKQRQKELRRSRRRWFAIIIVVVIVIFFWIVSAVYPVAIYHFDRKVVSRNLEKAGDIIEEKPEVMPYMAWQGELPDFMRMDMRFAEKFGWSVKYRFKNHTIILEMEENSWRESGYNWCICVDNKDYARLRFYTIEELSVQQDADALYFYIYDASFSVLTVTEEEAKSTRVADYPKDVPLEVYSYDSMRLGDVVLIRDGNDFNLWKAGKKVSTSSFDEGDVVCFVDDYSMLGTAENEVFFVYVYKDNDYTEQIGFKYIGKIDNAMELNRSYKAPNFVFEFPIGTEYKFPIFRREGELYTCLPSNLQDFVSYSLERIESVTKLSADADFDMELVKLDESVFYSAKFYYGYVSTYRFEGFSWMADITLKYKGTDFVYKMCPIYGYDREVDLTDEVEEALTTEVFTVDDYWDAIEAIRDEYDKLYNKRDY